jgi:hypothetical protein
MDAATREAITSAARRHAAESAHAQGLPVTVTDPDVLRQVAVLIHPARKAAA